MITALDTSVLLDVYRKDPQFCEVSKSALRACIAQGRLVACDVVWAETAGYFPSSKAAQEAMIQLGVEFSAIELEAALTASRAWARYKSLGGKRDRIVADFLIGAHAVCQAGRLLTRDRGFYRTYFSSLLILDPSTG